MTELIRNEPFAAGGSLAPDGTQTWMVRPDLSCYAVASPFGAAPIAARVVLEGTAEALNQPSVYRSSIEKPACSRLRGAILAASQAWDPAWQGTAGSPALGTTLAAILVDTDYAAVAHIGDCRVLQLREGAAIRRTTDHLARTREGRTAVDRIVGPNSNPHVEAWPVAPGDIFLLTAEVHYVVSEKEVLAHLARHPNLASPVNDLIELAGRRGGRDYPTAVAVRVPDAARR
jgi:serine/threonine protein phosphatase PrpC